MKTVVFDKTGTLTVGKPEVVSAVPFSSISLEDFCDVAAAVEVSFLILICIIIGMVKHSREEGFLCTNVFLHSKSEAGSGMLGKTSIT